MAGSKEAGRSIIGVAVSMVVVGALTVIALKSFTGDSDSGSGRTPVAGARTAACSADVNTIETAVATKRAADGAYPATVAELVAGGWLASVPAVPGYEMTLEVAGGQPTGRVLVNGLPAEQGCAATASP